MGDQQGAGLLVGEDRNTYYQVAGGQQLVEFCLGENLQMVGTFTGSRSIPLHSRSLVNTTYNYVNLPFLSFITIKEALPRRARVCFSLSLFLDTFI